MNYITLFDPSICSENLGDYIIMEAVEEVIKEGFPEAFVAKVPTHEKISTSSYEILHKSDFRIVGGTNLLSSNMNSYHQWNINLFDSLFLDDVILLGVGWWQYQEEPNYYTKLLLERVLSNDHIHSVRDKYTKEKLNSIGFDNVVNTACPTMWRLDKGHCQNVPAKKADSVLLTITSYKKDKTRDKKVYSLLEEHYDIVYLWPQGAKDYEYAKAVVGEKCRILPPSLGSFDKTLARDSLDYIGTRLHGGIRALNHKKRSLILAVDNRAKEIAASTNLPVVDRANIEEIKEWIYSRKETKLNLPIEEIEKWKEQFTSN